MIKVIREVGKQANLKESIAKSLLPILVRFKGVQMYFVSVHSFILNSQVSIFGCLMDS